MPRRPIAPLLAVLGLAVTAAAGHASEHDATLKARAILPAEASAAAPFSGVPNTDPAPAQGSTQPVGGFSALLDAPGKDVYWAMPDNGFGSKTNSRSFLLRVYSVRAQLSRRGDSTGEVAILDWITLRDPDQKIPFDIVTEGSGERLLTGGDFDIESFRVDSDGELWFGDEFGPFLLHTDASGKVLEAPIALPGVKSPDYPADFPPPFVGAANLARSNGFEGMAISRDGRTLYPTLEGPLTGDDPSFRRMYEFDIPSRSYAPGHRLYRLSSSSFLVSDLTALDRYRFVALERDNFEGPAAAHKQGFLVNLRRTGPDGALAKRPLVNLLDLRDPALISLPGRPGDIGLGDPFAMPYVTIEALLPLPGNRLAIVNDTNFGSHGRNPVLPDYSDFIAVQVPGLRGR